jgi:hypothetical protein
MKELMDRYFQWYAGYDSIQEEEALKNSKLEEMIEKALEQQNNK